MWDLGFSVLGSKGLRVKDLGFKGTWRARAPASRRVLEFRVRVVVEFFVSTKNSWSLNPRPHSV